MKSYALRGACREWRGFADAGSDRQLGHIAWSAGVLDSALALPPWLGRHALLYVSHYRRRPKPALTALVTPLTLTLSFPFCRRRRRFCVCVSVCRKQPNPDGRNFFPTATSGGIVLGDITAALVSPRAPLTAF